MSDPWKGMSADLQSSSRKLDAVTPNNSADLPNTAKAILIIADGNIAFVPADNADGEVFTINNLTAGTVIPVVTRRVMATGTTATVAAMVG